MEYFVYEYYRRSDVVREITDFLRDRWVAIHCNIKMHDGRPLLLRYHKGKPLCVRSEAEFLSLLNKLAKFKPRTFYGSANLYRRLIIKEDALNYIENVYARTPTWDIDSRLEWWRYTIEVGRLIVNELEKFGVIKSVYLKWSGKGLHVHIHERAISKEVYSKISPLDVAYCIVEFILKRIENKIKALNLSYHLSIKVENLMDPQRVFTAPMSLHRELDVCCIAFKPDDIDDFDISWIDPAISKNNPRWREFEEGEADELAMRAFKEIGPYPKYRVIKEVTEIPLERIRGVTSQEELSFRFSINDLRYNPNPPPLGKRKLVGNPLQAFLYIEDIVNYYVMGKLSIEEAINLLVNFRDITIPTQGYSEEDVKCLQKICDDVIKLLVEYKSRSDLKDWLLSKGKPRTISKILDFLNSA